MDILDTKYIPEDDLLNIAYSTNPDQIFNFCRINKSTIRICKKISWKKYINGDQYKYDKLLMVSAKNGYQTVFEHLIKNIKRYNIIINDIAINKSFRLALVNGYDNFSDYIWSILRDDTKKLQRAKYNVLLEQFIISENFNEAINLISDIIDRYDSDKLSEDISYIINTSLPESPSYKFMKKIVSQVKLKIGDVYNYDQGLIFAMTCRYGNIVLAEQLLPKLKNLLDIFIISSLLSCPSSAALKLIKKKYPEYHKLISPNYIGRSVVFRNSDILYDYVNRLSLFETPRVLLYSPLAFKPYEFINMLNQEDLCYDSNTINNVIFLLKEKSETYYAKILEEDAPLCEL